VNLVLVSRLEGAVSLSYNVRFLFGEVNLLRKSVIFVKNQIIEGLKQLFTKHF